MAGKRHHFIPQFLQRGFASHSAGDEHFIWVHRKGGAVFNSNIKNSGIEGQFYNHEGDTSVDDTITDAEGPLSAFVARELQGAPHGASVSAEAAAELIGHLSMRTRHVRQNLSSTGAHFMGEIYTAYSDPGTLRQKYLEHVRNDPSFLISSIEEMLVNQLGAMGIRKVPKEQLNQLTQAFLPHAMRLHLSGEGLDDAINTMAKAVQLANEGLRANPSRVAASAKEGHLRALRRGLTPPKKLEALRKLTYHVHEFADGELILGDSSVVYAVDSERVTVSFYDGLDKLLGVALPLSPCACLIGTAGAPCEAFATAEQLRRHVAECSLEFFLSHASSSQKQHLIAQIGKNAHFLTPDEIQGIMGELGLLG